MATIETSSPFLFLGNALCLDFVNTERMLDGDRVDLIESAEDLWAWLTESGALTQESAEAAKRQVPAERAMREARDLRAALRRMAGLMEEGAAMDLEIAEALNGHLNRRRGYERLTESGAVWRREFRAEDARGLDFLYHVAESAAYLLVSGDRKLVRKCESSRCILYFYDTTKNHGRRWCSMEACGNRHKAAEHYKRRRQVKNAKDETLRSEKSL